MGNCDDYIDEWVDEITPDHPVFTQILLEAKHLIETDQERYICYALGSVAPSYGDVFRHYASLRIQNYIQESMGMGEEFSLEDWLYVEKNVKEDHLTVSAMKEYRLAFIDHLINNVYRENKDEGGEV